MLALEQVMAQWRRHVESAPLDKHPTVWVGHFDGTGLLGCLSATEPESVGSAVIFLASPYSLTAAISECVIVVDVNRILHITHMVAEDPTHRTVDYHLPYGFDDHGKIRFGMAEKKPSAVWAACHVVHTQRASGRQNHDFQTAFQAALQIGEAVL